MTMETLETDDSPNVIAYRLGQVERAVRDNNESVSQKLDEMMSIKTDVITLQIQMAAVLKSRDRLTTALSAVSVSVIMLFVQNVFSIFGG